MYLRATTDRTTPMIAEDSVFPFYLARLPIYKIPVGLRYQHFKKRAYMYILSNLQPAINHHHRQTRNE